MTRPSLRLSISQNVFEADHGHQEMLDGLSRLYPAPSAFQTLIGPPNFAGNDTSEKYQFLPPSARQIFAFNTLARTLVL
ncbi:hypothetical protein TNIN_249371 [Trichonephila inaurata madagascariensis]|uniref:Uncharacterized protein n=1 Tax=Trichonephila inaurata madagascariensis TaxID=2747483 RepID=A0A8X7C4A3_9ARAC|nr:hypothetical protein TNIN_249371 [Trichonephila inaurata madagascariensis]